jgi:SAM-dependent methyltransferase
VNLRYLLLRLARHFMSESIARFLLKRRWIIRPGLESSDPLAAVEQYLKGLKQRDKSIKGQRALVFGYGGRFAVGVELLAQGASHVVLCDHFVLLDRERNLELLPKYEKYLHVVNEEVLPRPEQITLLHGDIRDEKIQTQISAVDLVLSTSVYEHLDDVEGITSALAKLTAPAGNLLHFVDLRDHYFKFPFEMLAYSETIWKNFLNPTSNLNRYRLPSYQKIFEKYFGQIQINVLARQEDEFKKMGNRVRQEFITGDISIDSVTLIELFAETPKHKG